MDALKQSATTGEVPGGDPEADSVAKRMRDLTARVETLELSSASKVAAAATVAANNAQNANKPVSVKEIKDAFNSKKFSLLLQMLMACWLV